MSALADLQPAWTLTGGGALVGCYGSPRTTRDLGLFLNGRAKLGEPARRVVDRLRGAGFEVTAIQSGSSLERLEVRSAGESTLVDLVAEPVAQIEAATQREVSGVRFQVDTEHEILVNKLCALLQRSEPRDLLDVQVLLERGGDLERALRDAPRKDGGFSRITLAWQLQSLALKDPLRAEGRDDLDFARLDSFRVELAKSLSRDAKP
ncbi:MAG TPA: nucleotidyl transferase AbiEii/AbiGii toxin family protein [Planctomycetota bacterium]|nr:nucleotidyl transferase AbiEii/AbiGii toxin family protein [Planctomycetota bacterium]